ncbi:MAG: hypothetical protein AUK63_659 [bacterium P3]|nr:MAG: hypothetical protein AUK63_659 [bacterium P3]KWW42142.1 MAG: hypothetical protein F083_481 [bacterium F083]
MLFLLKAFSLESDCKNTTFFPSCKKIFAGIKFYSYLYKIKTTMLCQH